jgi:iron complex outermembrane recepter protein
MKSCFLPVATVLATVGCLSLRAQTVPATSAPPPSSETAKEQAIELPKFTVSSERDISYTGREALGTTRIGVDLSDLAQSVQVLNRAFLNDVAPPILVKSLQYIGGVQTGTINWSVDRYMIRGFVGEGDFVDGFLTLTDKNTDTNLIDHVEVIKGPAAIFIANQGNTVGGVINKISKSPTDYKVGTLTIQWGRYDTNRADLDIGGPITADKKFQYRFLLGGQDSKGYYDYTYEKRTMITPMLAYHFNADSQVWLKFETFDSHYSSYNGIPLDGRTNTMMALPRTANISGDTPKVWRTDNFWRLWGQFTTRPADFVALRLAAFDSADYQRKIEATFTKRFNPTQVVIDPSTGQPTTVTVPGTIIPANPPGTATPIPAYVPGTPLGRDLTAVNPDYQPRREVQADAVFNFNTGPAGHKLLVGANAVDYPRKTWAYDASNNDAVLSKLDPFNYGTIASPANIVAVNFNQPPAQLTDTSQTFAKVYALETLSLLKDRIIANYGFSKTRYEFARTITTYNQTLADTAGPQPFVTSYAPNAVMYKNLVQYGLLLKPLSNVSVFYGNNSNFAANGFSGTTANPATEGKQQEVGVKTKWLQGRLNVNISYFDALANHIKVQAFPQIPGAQDVFNASVTSRGFDGDFSFAATKNLDFIGSFAFFHAHSVLAHPWDLIVQPGDGLVHSWGWMPVNNVSQNNASLFTRYKFTDATFKGLSLGVGINSIDKRAIDDNSGANVFYGYIPGRTLVDLVFGYETKRMNYQLNVDNALNKKYIYASRSQLVLIPGVPTNLRVSVTYKFW